MNLPIIGVVLFFTCVGASSASSDHMDFMVGAKKENILHLKDPHAEVEDFSEAFKDVANSEEKIKGTFRILNRPNDSRFKLDLLLIISQMDVMDDESQSLENKQNAWAVLKPLLEKYDKNFTYPADYDIQSGEYIEVIVDDWLDRYTQDKVVRKQSNREDESSTTEGYEIAHSEDEAESSTEYQLVDGEAVLQATTEYYIPEVEEPEVLEVLAEEGDDSDGVPEEDGGRFEFSHRSGFVVVEHKPFRAGSIRGIPGVHFPDYNEIPISSFSCADKKYIPGFYADMETGCQVFHVCWPHRRESFLCPIGTLFNQAILSCDYWYSTNCSLSPLHYDVNNRIQQTTPSPPTHKTTPKPHTKTTTRPSELPATPSPSLADVDWARVLSILPIKSKVTFYPSKTSAAKGKEVLFGKTDKALKKAMAMQLIGKVLHAAETLAKASDRTLPIKYAPKKPQLTEKPGKIHTSEKKQPPKIIERFVVKPSPKKFETLKPLLAGKLVSSRKVDKQQKVKLAKGHTPDVLLGAMEMAGTVLQKDILPLTRMALVESSVKHSKAKKL